MSSSLRSVRDKPKPLGQRARLENGPAWTGSALPRHPAPTHCTVKPAIVVTLLVAIGWATRHPSNHAMASVCPRRVAVHVCVTVCAVDVTLCATVCDVNKSETVKLARYVCTMQCDRSDDVCSCVAHEFDLPQEALKSSLRPTRMPFRPLPLYSRRGRNPSGVLCSACFLGGVVTLRAAHSAWQPHAVCCGADPTLGANPASSVVEVEIQPWLADGAKPEWLQGDAQKNIAPSKQADGARRWQSGQVGEGHRGKEERGVSHGPFGPTLPWTF